MRDQVEFAGFAIDQFLVSTGSDYKFRAMLRGSEHWLNGVQSVIVRAIK
jgi:hypothetical protein